jgi:hypothetical protein
VFLIALPLWHFNCITAMVFLIASPAVMVVYSHRPPLWWFVRIAVMVFLNRIAITAL